MKPGTDGLPDGRLTDSLGPRKLRLTYAEYVMGEHPATLLFRERGKGGVQGLDLFFLLIEFGGRGSEAQGAMLDAVPRSREYCAL